jgi:hypothetical protein
LGAAHVDVNFFQLHHWCNYERVAGSEPPDLYNPDCCFTCFG